MEKGARDRALAIAGNLLNLGFTAEQTAAATGLPLAEILALKEAEPARNGSNH